MTKLKITPKHVLEAIKIHAGQSREILKSDVLDDSMKILVLGQLNVAIEILLHRCKAYNGYAYQLPEINELVKQYAAGYVAFEQISAIPAYHCHSYISVTRAPVGDLHLQSELSI